MSQIELTREQVEIAVERFLAQKYALETQNLVALNENDEPVSVRPINELALKRYIDSYKEDLIEKLLKRQPCNVKVNIKVMPSGTRIPIKRAELLKFTEAFIAYASVELAFNHGITAIWSHGTNTKTSAPIDLPNLVVPYAQESFNRFFDNTIRIKG